jgi:hypothetical protein
VFKEYQTIRAFPPGIGVGEMRADVAEARSPEQRIAHRVSKDVAVRVADGPFIEGNRDAADHQGPAFGEAMQIIANAAAKFTHEMKSNSSGAKVPILASMPEPKCCSSVATETLKLRPSKRKFS